MLEEILEYLNNWFVSEVYSGTFTIEDGKIALSFLQDGQYFRVLGSIFNDGVYCYDEKLELKDETFSGVIMALAVPQAVIKIADEVKEWQDKYGDAVSGPYNSESFGGYSYSKGNSNSANAKNATSWQSYFAERLAPYKKLRGCDHAQPAYQDRGYKKPFNPDHPYGV